MDSRICQITRYRALRIFSVQFVVPLLPSQATISYYPWYVPLISIPPFLGYCIHGTFCIRILKTSYFKCFCDTYLKIVVAVKLGKWAWGLVDEKG